MKEQVQSARKRALLPECALRHGLQSTVSIRQPTDNQTRIRKS
jgi:hypothetical protein